MDDIYRLVIHVTIANNFDTDQKRQKSDGAPDLLFWKKKIFFVEISADDI